MAEEFLFSYLKKNHYYSERNLPVSRASYFIITYWLNKYWETDLPQITDKNIGDPIIC
jgi:hypothetical protein